MWRVWYWASDGAFWPGSAGSGHFWHPLGPLPFGHAMVAACRMRAPFHFAIRLCLCGRPWWGIRHIIIKVVKRLSVNRLPVKLPITGFNFQLPITDLPTFGFSFVSQAHTGQQRQDPDIPSPPDVRLHINPAFDCRVCSSPLPASGHCSRERWGGEEVRTGRPAWITET